MGWTRCFGCEKLQRNFMAQTFALIAPVQYVLQQVSCSYETIPNAPKYYKTDWNICLGSNGRIGCVRCEKIPTWLRATNFCINCTTSPVLHRVSCSYEKIPNAPEHYEMHQNLSLGSNGVDLVRWLRKNTTWLRGTNFCINCTSFIYFATSFLQLRNDPKCTKTFV